MNTEIEYLRDTRKGRVVYLIGNGPSLADTDLESIMAHDSIAMNRIELIYPTTTWRPTFYLFCSSNCEDPRWGKEWCESVLFAAWEPATTPIIWSYYQSAIEFRSGILPHKTEWLTTMTEIGAGHPQAFSKDAVERLDKSGTTMNVALQLAYFMGYDEIRLLGCDSNWETAIETKKTGDPNHFDLNYHASIADGDAEFKRMNDAHKVARAAFDEVGRRVVNMTPGSALTAYEKEDFR